MKATIAIATIIVFAALMAGCGRKADPLPNEYGVFVASRSQKFVVDSKGGGIPGLGMDLREVGSYNEFIFGRMGAADGGAAGFFLLNSSNGQAQISLSEDAWIKELKAVGIPMPPERLDPYKKPPTRR